MDRNTKGIFISYRRGESAAHAGWLAERLSEHFGEHKVFRDIDSIEPGLDFVEAIERALDSAEVLLAVIGKSWLTAADTTGRARLQNSDDYVRREIASALKRNLRVVPVLVQGATMPSIDELPDDLAALPRRNAFELHDTSWKDDVQRLTITLSRVVGRQEEGGSRRNHQRFATNPHEAVRSTQQEETSGTTLLQLAKWMVSPYDAARSTQKEGRSRRNLDNNGQNATLSTMLPQWVGWALVGGTILGVLLVLLLLVGVK